MTAGAFLLSACGSDQNQDIKAWMKEASKDIKGHVLPLPEITPFPIVSYDAGDLVNPFSPAKVEPEKKADGGGGIKPDTNRFREPLEGYPLESLRMVGLLRQGKMTNAIIRAPDNKAYLVKIGNYMGQNFGMVADITESEVKLKELVQDSSGDWVERSSSLLLQEQEKTK